MSIGDGDANADIAWLKRYEALLRMGFADDAALSAAQKYQNVPLCVDHLTTKQEECMEDEDEHKGKGKDKASTDCSGIGAVVVSLPQITISSTSGWIRYLQ